MAVKPAKIVAGLDAEETNRFLQILGELAAKRVDTRAAVLKITGRSPPEVTAGAPIDPPSVIMEQPEAPNTSIPEAPTEIKSAKSAEKTTEKTAEKKTDPRVGSAVRKDRRSSSQNLTAERTPSASASTENKVKKTTTASNEKLSKRKEGSLGSMEKVGAKKPDRVPSTELSKPAAAVKKRTTSVSVSSNAVAGKERKEKKRDEGSDEALKSAGVDEELPVATVKTDNSLNDITKYAHKRCLILGWRKKRNRRSCLP